MRQSRTAAPSLPRRLAPPLAVGAGVAAAFARVGAVDPGTPGHYPACPFLRLTGLYCPACGGLRGAHALVHGELLTALGANALAVAGYAAFALLWGTWLARTVRGRAGVRLPLRAAHWWALGAAVTLFTVVRNLPYGSVLAP
ncbi:DUF2752 domain-containing protein [Streptomyces gamaensis]|uniref:DUF2752 domain-containing protein n=1 Tax=Streptomyces gamaensis TaxID=1763542 RepID=A0ABW0Z7P6_9ACTN